MFQINDRRVSKHGPYGPIRSLENDFTQSGRSMRHLRSCSLCGKFPLKIEYKNPQTALKSVIPAMVKLLFRDLIGQVMVSSYQLTYNVEHHVLWSRLAVRHKHKLLRW